MTTSWQDIISTKRDAETVQARHEAMYNLYFHGGKTYKEIGDMMGGRTPGTVHHGCMKIAATVKPLSMMERMRVAASKATVARLRLLRAHIDLAEWEKLILQKGIDNITKQC